MARKKKVVPPVTPKIVQAPAGQRFIWYVLLICLFSVALWLSYEYGRSQAPAKGGAPLVQSHDMEQQISELEKERDNLKQQVAELKQSMEKSNQALSKAQTRINALQQEQSSLHIAETAEPETAPEEAPAAERFSGSTSDTADKRLKLENMRILEMESADAFRIEFSVMHDGAGSGRVMGTIWVAINGLVDGKPKRLTLKTLSPAGRSHVKMSFDQQQDVMEDIVLPKEFQPKNILIEAKPYGDKYIGASDKFEWSYQ